MQGTVVYMTRHCPYMSKKQLCAELDYKMSSINKICNGVASEIGRRYNPYVIAENRYSFFAVVDYLKYRSLLECEETRKYVPPYDPAEVAEVCGQSMRRAKG